MQSRKSVVRAAAFGVISAIAAAQMASAGNLVAGYTIGSGALSPNGESLFIDNAATGGGDATSASGVLGWSAVLRNVWLPSDQVSLTGIAIPIHALGASNTTLNGTFTFTFYDIGADNTFSGIDNETLLGSTTLNFSGNGSTGTSAYYGVFDAPLSFTAQGTGIAVRIGNSTGIRLKTNVAGSSAGVTRNNNTTGAVLVDANPGFRMSLAGFNLGDPTTDRWVPTIGGNWDVASNWSNNSVPNGAGDKVLLGTAITESATIALNGARTVGKLTFESPLGYTLSAGSGGSLVLENSGSDAEVIVSAGTNSITAPVSLISNTSVSVVSGAQLSLGAVSGSAGLTKLGAGALVLTDSASYSGPTSINAGSVVLGGEAATVTLSNVSLAAEGVLDYRNANSTYDASAFTSGSAGTVRVGAGTLAVASSGGPVQQSSVVVASGASVNASSFGAGYQMPVGQSIRLAGTFVTPALNVFADNSIGVGDDLVRAVGTGTITGSLVLSGDSPAAADGLVFQLNGDGSRDLLNVTGQIIKSGANPIRITVLPDINARLQPSYDIITFNSGTLSASDFEVVGAQAFPSSRISYAANVSTPGVVRIVEVGSALNLTWTGASGNFWDNASTVNFVDATSNPEHFRSLDSVVFNDTSNVRGVVTVGDLFATQVVFDTANTYNLRHSGTGQGLTGSSALIKRGSGKLILESNLDFTGDGTAIFNGPVTVEGGTLSLGGGISGATGNLGLTTGLSLAGGATLELFRSGTPGTVASYNFPITGSGEVVKRGDNANLGGNNLAWTGLLRVEENSLNVTNPNALGTTDQGVVVNNAGQLRFNIAGAYTIADAVTINSGSAPGAQLAIGGTGTGTLTAGVTYTVSGSIQLDGGSTLNLAGGLTASGDITANGAGSLRLGPSTINGSLSRTNATGLLSIDDDVTVGGTLSLTVANSAAVITAVADPLAPNVLSVGGISLAAGTTAATRIDITNNILQVNYTGASPLPQLLGLILDGRDDNDSNGNVLDAGESVIYSSLLPIAGQDIGYSDDGTSVRIRKTIVGDANVDGTVGFADLLALAQNYNTPSGAFWFQGDFDYSGDIGFSDLLVLAQNYNGSLALAHSDLLTGGADARFAADFTLAMSVVPEPSSIVLIALPALGLLRRRRSA